MPVIITISANKNEKWTVSLASLAFETPVSIYSVPAVKKLAHDPVAIMNSIHDWVNTVVGVHPFAPKITPTVIIWTKAIKHLAETKGNIVIEPTLNMSIPFSFDEIKGFFNDKPGLVTLEEEKPSPAWDITVTPWKPFEGDPILIHLPHVMKDAEVSNFVRNIFLVAPITEIRWQRGHAPVRLYGVEDSVGAHEGIRVVGEYGGEGHYVRVS